FVAGKKGVSFFNFQRRPIAQRLEAQDTPRYADVNRLADDFIGRFTSGEFDAVHVAYMNFVSAGVQRADVMTLLPLAGVAETTPVARSGAADAKASTHAYNVQTLYDFSPAPRELLDE